MVRNNIKKNKIHKTTRFIFIILLFCVSYGISVNSANAVFKVLSNSRHAFGNITNTIDQLLGSGHLGNDVIVHSTYLDNTYYGNPNIALDENRTFYDESGNAVSSQAPYQIYTSSFTNYSGDSVIVYNQFDGVDLIHNYASTADTSGPPIFHVAPGGTASGSKRGVEWTIDSSSGSEITFSSTSPSLSELTARSAGLLISVRHDNPTWNWFDVKAAIRQTASNWDTGYDDANYGFGNVYYASSTALSANDILLQPPIAKASVSGVYDQLTFTLYPFKQTRRVKEVLFMFDNDPGFQGNELSFSDIVTTLGGIKVNEYTDTTATTTITATSTAFSNKYFVWFTSDNTDDSIASFSRIDTYSVLGPFSQNEILFSGQFNLSSPEDNAVTSTSPTFEWETQNSYLGISKYQLYIDGVLDTDNITSTSTSPSTSLSEGTHTWYVKAVNGAGSATTSISTRTINVVSGYTDSQLWYVDNILGDDNNPGTQSAPWRTLAKATVTAKPGNTVIVIKNNNNPYRETVGPLVGDSLNGNIVFRGVSADSKPEVWGSEDVSQGTSGGWTVYSGGNSNTYKKTISSTVNVLSVGSSISTLEGRTWSNSADSLNEGEWSYSGNTLYYRLNSGEDINTLHIEAGQRDYGLRCTLMGTFKNIIIRYSNSTGVALGRGCIGEGIEVYDSGNRGILMSGSGSQSILGPILRYSVISGNYNYGIYMQLPTYARIYNNVVHGNDTGLYVQLWAHNSMVRNNIFTNNTKNIRFSLFSEITEFVSSNNNWSNGIVDSSWTNVYKGSNNKASTTPLFTDISNRNFRLQQFSQNIDSGVSISGLTTDIIGNPIYGNPDIGAYEYQPPYTIGENSINISGKTRLYADGKYRYITATSSSETADIMIRPKNGWGSDDYSEYMNITINTWNKDGDYEKEWVESSDSAGIVFHTIGDLEPGKKYIVKVDGVDYDSITADDTGKASFDYTGGYSTHVFNITEAPIGNGPIFTGTALDFSGYVEPRMQIVYPDGTVVYQDDLNNNASTTVSINKEVKLHNTEISTATSTIFTKLIATSTPMVNNNTPEFQQLNYIFYGYLKRGVKNKEVEMLQQVLRKLGFFTYQQNTGYFGVLTEKAVKEFQKANNIEAVGSVGPKTRAALNSIGVINETYPAATIEYIQNEINRLIDIVKKLQVELLRKSTAV